jgi:hypothetical protein
MIVWAIMWLAFACFAMSLALLVFAGFLFVDDTDLVNVAIDKDESPAQVTARMQAAVDAWHGGLLRTTGGALKAAKSSWGLIAIYWDSGQQWHYLTEALLEVVAKRTKDGHKKTRRASEKNSW